MLVLILEGYRVRREPGLSCDRSADAHSELVADAFEPTMYHPCCSVHLHIYENGPGQRETVREALDVYESFHVLEALPKR